MHLVFVSSLVPVANPKSGYDIANRVIVDALNLAGHRVSVIGFLLPGEAPAYPDETRLLGTLEVTNARVGAARKLGWLARAVMNREPVSVAKMHAASRTDVAAALASLAPFDALVLNSVQLPGAFHALFSAYPHVFVAHNVEARSAADNAANAASAIHRLLFAREAQVLTTLERRLCDAASHVFTLADADQAELGLTPSRASTLPLVTSVAAPPAPSLRRPAYDVGMIGSWTWAANRAGLDWFLGEIVSRLPADFTIAIAGGLGNPPQRLPANVSLLGRVPDARDFVRSVRVVPLISRTGTGVQLKTIETFEMGMPTVATANALRGIAAVPANCALADDPADFAAALTRLVIRSRAGEDLDLDGRTFHTGQLDGLLTALGEGLKRVANDG
jgi:hypothetical protein